MCGTCRQMKIKFKIEQQMLLKVYTFILLMRVKVVCNRIRTRDSELIEYKK